MKLADLRRLAIKKRMRIRFDLPNGMEAIMNVHGTAKVPGLKQVPGFNLEESLKSVRYFHIESNSGGAAAQTVSAEELEKMIPALKPGAGAGADHEE